MTPTTTGRHSLHLSEVPHPPVPKVEGPKLPRPQDQETVPQTQDRDSVVLTRLLNERHSCRAFLPKPVPEDIIMQMLTMAQRTASWCNIQPWQVIVTQPQATARLGRALLERAGLALPAAPDIPYPREYSGVYLKRRRSAGFALYHQLGIERGDAEGRRRQMLENFRFFGAPHLALITSHEALGTYGAVDCGGYIATFLLAAQALRVGAVAQAAIARDSAFLRECLGIPRDRIIVAGIAFGLPDETHPINGFRPERVPIDEAVTWLAE